MLELQITIDNSELVIMVPFSVISNYDKGGNKLSILYKFDE